MEYRRLGSTGMYVSEITYGNCITHGSQVEEQAAIKCVRAALDLGITTLDTADVYAGTRAESTRSISSVLVISTPSSGLSSGIPVCSGCSLTMIGS